MKKLINILLFLLLIASLIIIFICLIKIVKWVDDNSKTGKVIKNINENVTIDISNEEIINVEDNILASDPYWSFKNVDFSKLYEINNETIGWISMENLKVNYPVVQHNDNNYYLTHSFDRSSNGAGWVFLDYRNNYQEIDQNTIIYAHGRLDNTMFGSLRQTLKESWYSNSNNYIINFSTNYYNSLWQIFSIYKIETTNDYLQINFSNDEEYMNFLNMLKNRSIIDFNTTVSSNNKIITLSTCYNNDIKLVIHAKLIKIQYKN